MNAKTRYHQLIKKAHAKRMRVRENWNSTIWRGMNPKAAKAHKLKRYPARTLSLSKSENSYAKKADTLNHEINECTLMRNSSLKEYNRVHKLVARHDRT